MGQQQVRSTRLGSEGGVGFDSSKGRKRRKLEEYRKGKGERSLYYLYTVVMTAMCSRDRFGGQKAETEWES